MLTKTHITRNYRGALGKNHQTVPEAHMEIYYPKVIGAHIGARNQTLNREVSHGRDLETLSHTIIRTHIATHNQTFMRAESGAHSQTNIMHTLGHLILYS